MERYTISEDESQNLNPMSWALESHEIGSQNAYTGISEDGDVSQAYVNRTLSVAERQVVLGGHRLANMIASIFKDIEVAGDEGDIFLQ